MPIAYFLPEVQFWDFEEVWKAKEKEVRLAGTAMGKTVSSLASQETENS